MLILYVAMKYDYGHVERGPSFEHYNFYDSLLHMGHDILYFDFMTLMQEHGGKWMNRRLLEVVKAEKPDLMFTVLVTDEFDPKAVQDISGNTDIITLNWFCDDHWRFDNYSRYWAPRFDWVVTTAQSALPKYAHLGYPNVIKSQWACNHFLYRKLDLPFEYDVTFVGQPHGNRRATIQTLRNAGINVQVWGSGWETRRLGHEEMIQVFNQSRINLNLSNASFSGRPPSVTELAARRRLSWLLDRVPLGAKLKEWRRQLRNRAAGRVIYPDQIKGRNFEIPGSGGFLLTGQADNLEEYYDIRKEVVCFDSTSDLVEKIRYYLSHEDEREAIALAGYQRTICEHTYAHRFTEIFQQLGLSCEPLEAALAGNVHQGQSEEIR
ncbi:MAG: glycosyltransferase [Chloroflexi bacterium]|nr:glycosyltransferase [Chloroflexota bacterium]